jgi:PiT family inorganic phosphate transporter
MEHVTGSLTVATFAFLALALLLSLGFEFVNGFHDTANAVATVIYTNSLPPWIAVVLSGLFNLLGVLTSSGAVAFGILALLPVELVINVGSGAGFAMVFALLISAIIWNLGTWYLGLPASSSHTLIGAIMGVGLMNSVLTPGHVFGEGVNWDKVHDTVLALVISPLVGFLAAGLLLIAFKVLVKRPELYAEPPKGKAPAPWIRGLLTLTCIGVSFAHGSNDGQKGMGLIMLILIGVVPAAYALDLGASHTTLAHISATSAQTSTLFAQKAHADPVSSADAGATISAYLKTSGHVSDATYAALATKSTEIAQKLGSAPSLADLPASERGTVRTDIYLVSEGIGKLTKQHLITDAGDQKFLAGYKQQLDHLTKFIPLWVKIAVALALGLGTMIGWKRIVVTVGEKIGKSHLTYGQGASAELVAMATIGAADVWGLPVSTTHVLSSGVAGTMAANHSGLQMQTLRNLLLAWVLTLPVCVFLGAAIFGGTLAVIFHGFPRH